MVHCFVRFFTQYYDEWTAGACFPPLGSDAEKGAIEIREGFWWQYASLR
jgi:hypothetical protein